MIHQQLSGLVISDKTHAPTVIEYIDTFTSTTDEIHLLINVNTLCHSQVMYFFPPFIGSWSNTFWRNFSGKGGGLLPKSTKKSFCKGGRGEPPISITFSYQKTGIFWPKNTISSHVYILALALFGPF